MPWAMSRIAKRMGEPTRSPLSHIPVLRGTYASCYRRSYAERSSFRAASFAALRAVEDHPGREVLAEALETVLHPCRHEQHFAGLEGVAF